MNVVGEPKSHDFRLSQALANQVVPKGCQRRLHFMRTFAPCFAKSSASPRVYLIDHMALNAFPVQAPNSKLKSMNLGGICGCLDLAGASFGSREADVYVAVALNRAESQVSAGENSGHRLAHVSVVKSLTKVGALKQGQVLAQDVQLKLGPESDSSGLRLIAFVQEPRQGRVLGAASMMVNTR